MTVKTWDAWIDVLGNVYGPGDYVAIATVSNKSPQMVIGKVLRINRVDSHGDPITARVRVLVQVDGEWETRHVREDSCTVQVQPLVDARGFGRWNDKPITYRLPQNILKVVPPEGFEPSTSPS